VCIYIYIHSYIHTYIYIHTCIHTYINKQVGYRLTIYKNKALYLWQAIPALLIAQQRKPRHSHLPSCLVRAARGGAGEEAEALLLPLTATLMLR
jgi:hypothetical protein